MKMREIFTRKREKRDLEDSENLLNFLNHNIRELESILSGVKNHRRAGTRAGYINIKNLIKDGYIQAKTLGELKGEDPEMYEALRIEL